MVTSMKGHTSGQQDEDVERSLARRKKGHVPVIVNLPCPHKDCDKVFHRKCDLTKHEKIHSRPFKCSVLGCKYQDLGFPTQKELERHANDKHGPPVLYTCDICPFKTKRKSNLLQHKEKKHGEDIGVQATKNRAGSSIQIPKVPNNTPTYVDRSAISNTEQLVLQPEFAACESSSNTSAWDKVHSSTTLNQLPPLFPSSDQFFGLQNYWPDDTNKPNDFDLFDLQEHQAPGGNIYGTTDVSQDYVNLPYLPHSWWETSSARENNLSYEYKDILTPMGEIELNNETLFDPHDGLEYPVDPAVAPTDSGYGSFNPPKQAHTTSTSQDDTWETGTVYSFASVETTRRDTILQKFAEQLYKDLAVQHLSRDDATAICDSLPDLLADFALRLGQRSSNSQTKEAMVFVRKYRSDLTRSLMALITETPEEEEELLQTKRGTDEMSVQDKMRMWQNTLNHEDAIEPDAEIQPETTEDNLQPENSETVQEFDKYAEHVLGDYSYPWLLARLRNRISLTSSQDDLLEITRQVVLQALPKIGRLGVRWTPTFRAMFEVPWPLRLFLLEQFPDIKFPSIGRVITITGSKCDAQALTCEQYMEQTWPCTGIHLVELLHKVVTSETMVKHSCERPDGAVIEAQDFHNSLIQVTVVGTQSVIAEVAEQLSWLGAAFRTSPQFNCNNTSSGRKFVTCKPSISFSSTFTDKIKELRHMHGKTYASFTYPFTYAFSIDFDMEEIDYTAEEGSCWDQMIHNVIMVRGFPIRRRVQQNLGLEISLKVAAELIGTRYVNHFAANTFIKGYSAMLLPTIQVNDIVVWHLLVNPSGQHLSYLDHNFTTLQKISFEDIGNSRHIIGWCSHALNYAGAADSHLAVRHANLPKAATGCVLSGDDISFDKNLTSDDPFNIPRQYHTVHARIHGCSKMFRYLSQRFVLLWDKADSRGWLVNGVNALLHLVRTSLHLEERDSVGDLFVLKQSDLKEPEQPHSAKAAFKFFGELNNLRAKVSVKTIGMDKQNQCQDEYEVLNERVEQYFHILEKALTYSEKLRDTPAKTGKANSASRLEGWDFFHLANETGRVNACMLPLPIMGHSWLKLVRSIGAATLFGQRFGELIRPSSTNCCDGWKTLPIGKCYLAVNTADLQKIMECNGDSLAKPQYLSESLLWHNPATAFENCGCAELGEADTRLVQQPCLAMGPCSCPRVDKSDFDLDKHGAGAVIFGHNPIYGPLPMEENDDGFEDSGLGSSLTDSRSRDTDLRTQSTSSTPLIQRENSGRSYGDGLVSGQGHGHWGDNFQNVVHHHYAAPIYAPQQIGLPQDHLESSNTHIRGLIGTKRIYSETQVSGSSLPATQSDHSGMKTEQSSSKRIRTMEPSSSSYDNVASG